jgi:nicotinate-nucleotide adenylyltransferase
MTRIGIYAGTFDPVHTGHMAFALQAQQAAKLNKIYFMPERRPRAKHPIEHFAHRSAMLKRATKPYRGFNVLELSDIDFSINRTLPKLQTLFDKSQLVFLIGSDVAKHLGDWPDIETLLAQSELVIGLRGGDTRENISKVIKKWPTQPKAVTVIDSHAPNISSGKIRQAIGGNVSVSGLLKSVATYSKRNWLYVSLVGKSTLT